MGYYIDKTKLAPLAAKGKASQLIAEEGAKEIPTPFTLTPNADLVCVVENTMFEAAAFIFSERELQAFSHDDGRPKTWLEMPLGRAAELSGCSR